MSVHLADAGHHGFTCRKLLGDRRKPFCYVGWLTVCSRQIRRLGLCYNGVPGRAGLGRVGNEGAEKRMETFRRWWSFTRALWRRKWTQVPSGTLMNTNDLIWSDLPFSPSCTPLFRSGFTPAGWVLKPRPVCWLGRQFLYIHLLWAASGQRLSRPLQQWSGKQWKSTLRWAIIARRATEHSFTALLLQKL